MFDAKRTEFLNLCKWEPSPEPDLLGYIEAWWVADQDGGDLLDTGNYHYRRGLLTDDEVDDWIHRRRDFAPPRYSSISDKPLTSKLCCVRILMCERLGWWPPTFAMSQKSFRSVEKEFALSRATLPLMCRHAGLEYHRLVFDHRSDKKGVLPSVSVVIKYPQMFQLGNLGFSMTHNLNTGDTLAFLHGWSMFSFQNSVTGEQQVSHAERIHRLLEPSVSLWRHPLLLPTLIFQEHLMRCDDFTRCILSGQVEDIEEDLGVTRSGRLFKTRHAVPEVIKQLLADDERRLWITSVINTTLTDAINFLNVLKWDQRLGAFIKRVDKELSWYYETANMGIGTVKELESAVDHFCCEAASAYEYVESIKARLEMQLNVLYNFMAQAGNDLNSRIAATTGLDSAAMKTLAFVTTVFLPPAFIASLFSMSMFDWMTPEDGSSSHGVVSAHFWIYWVVSAPLTVGILLGWRFWWNKQKIHYAKEYPQILSVVKEQEKEEQAV